MKKNYTFALQLVFLASLILGVSVSAWAGPEPVFSTDTLNFGEVFQTQSTTLTLTVSNNGDAAYIITGVTATPAVFIENTLFGIVEPGQSFDISVVFTPPTTGQFNGALSIQSIIGTTTIALTGRGVEPTLFSYSPDTLFVTLPSGSRDTVPLTFTNTGSSTLQYNLDYVTESSVGQNAFWESFESSPWDFVATPPYSSPEAVTDPEAPQGDKVLKLTGGVPDETTGLFYDTPGIPYKTVSYWFKPTSPNVISGVFRMYTPWGMLFNCWYNGATQQYNVYVVSNAQLAFSMTLNQWHHVEFAEIDYLYHRFDLYLDGQKVLDDYNWYFETLSITRIQISNWDNATTYFDAFTASVEGTNADFMSFLPPSGSVPAQESYETQVVFNAEGLTPGEYTGRVWVENNSQNNPNADVPFVMTVTAGARLEVRSPDTLDFGQVFVGIESTQSITAANLGSDPLLIAQIIASSPDLSINPTYGIVPGFDSLMINIGLSADAPGPFLAYVDIQSSHGNKTLVVKATAEHPPVLQIEPDSICVSIARGQDSTLTVVLQNTGLGPLNYEIPADGQALNQALHVAAININGVPLEALNTLRDSSVRLTELNFFPTDLSDYDLILFPRDEFTDPWYYFNFMTTVSSFVQQGGGALFLGRPYGDILSATGLFSGSHYFNYYSNLPNAQLVNIPGHPVLEGLGSPLAVTDFLFGVYSDPGTLTPIVSDQLNQTTLIGYEAKGQGISGFLGYDFNVPNPDSRRLLLNMTRWLSGRQFPEWLTSNSPLSGALAPGESDTLHLSLSAAELVAGEYHYDMLINSNDPNRGNAILPIKIIVLDVPVAAFAASDAYLCDGAVSFTNNSQNDATSYLWNFGDGNTSTDEAPSHVYQQDGIYSVELIACNFLGCDTTIREDLITVNLAGLYCDTLQLPFGQNNLLETTACTGVLYDSGGPASVYSNGEYNVFTITTTPGKILRLRFYDVEMESCCDRVSIYDGNPNLGGTLIGTVTGISFNQVFSFQTSTNLAYLVFQSDFSVTGQGFRLLWDCGEDFAPEAFFTQYQSGCQNFISFQNQSVSAGSYFWDFGDGTTSNQINPLHIFENTGSYEVTLYAIEGADTSAYTSIVNIDEIAFYATGSHLDEAFVNEPITFSIESPFPLSQVIWEINGAVANSTLPVVASFPAPGQYPIYATIYGVQGCVIYYQDSILIRLPDGVDNSLAAKGISMKLAPNPTKDYVMVSIDNIANGPAIWRLIDGIGRVVMQGNWEGSPQLREQINMSALPAGLYRLVVQQGEKTGFGQLVKD